MNIKDSIQNSNSISFKNANIMNVSGDKTAFK